MDRRVEKTQDAISQALTDLTKEKSLQKVTVRDLCQRANINRSTFYLHYKNIDDLIQSIEADIATSLAEVIGSIETDDLVYQPEILTDLFIRILQAIDENSDLILSIMGPAAGYERRVTIEQVIENIIIARMDKAIASEAIQAELSVSQTYIAVTISSIFTGTVAEWLLNGKKESPEDLAIFISQIAYQPIINRLINLPS